MGCDIHMFTEIKRKFNDKEVWVNSDRWVVNPYYLLKNDDDNDEWEKPMDIDSIYTGRNYELFATLANVRGMGSPVIAEPKDLPNDVCSITKAESDRWNGDGHSHSYFTLAEFVDYAKDNPNMDREGYLTDEDAKKFDEDGLEPNDWSWGQTSTYGNYRTWSEPSIIQPIIDSLRELYKKEHYTWPEKQTREDEEKIRIVFWFDN